MAEAKLNLPRRFYLLPPTQSLVLTPSLAIYDDTGVQITNSPFTGTLFATPTELGLLGVYRTSPVSFPAAGTYYWVWTAAGVKTTGTLEVLNDPIPEYGLGVPRKYRHATPNYQVINDLVLKVYDSDGTIVDTYPTQVGMVAGVYETVDDVVLTEEDTYLFVWTSAAVGYSAAAIETVLVLNPGDLRTLKVYVIDIVPNPQVPQVDVEVLLSKTDGMPLQKMLTNENGRARLTARNGSYVVCIRKAGKTFSKNALSITVTDPTTPNSNIYYLYATPFEATFDATPLLDGNQKSLMTVRLAKLDGEPLAHTPILISNHEVPDVITGVDDYTIGLVGGPKLITTDGNGYAETYLIRGQTVTVALEGSSVRRTFEVPDVNTFDLMDILSNTSDGFDVVQPNIQVAMRSSP